MPGKRKGSTSGRPSAKRSKKISLVDFDQEMLEDIGFVTAMNMVMITNYAQTGHFGGPLSYTPANVALHLGLSANGGINYDIRDPKHPFADKFMLTGGHCVPTCYSLWMILYESMLREHKETGNDAYKCDPKHAILPVDAIGFRRSPGAVETILQENGLEDNPLFEQAKLRGIRALMGHSETTDVTNDVNGGPSGIGVATTAGKAMFWDWVNAPEHIKIVAFEGEFAFTEGHAQELKTIAAAQQVGKRLRIFFSYNNAGIDDSLVGGVVPEGLSEQYDITAQFSSYGWNVFVAEDGASYEQILLKFKEMEDWPAEDKRPMVLVAHTVKGWWPAAVDGKISGVEQIVNYQSHPYGFKMNSPYFLALAESFEKKFGVKFVGIHEGIPTNEKDRLIQLKQNIDVCMSALELNGGRMRSWIARRLVHIADNFATLNKTFDLAISTKMDPYTDPRLKVENLPEGAFKVTTKHPTTGEEEEVEIALTLPPGKKWGTRRAISEFGKWCNYVTGNRWVTIAADLSNSVNLEKASLTGHYNAVSNPNGTRLKAAIQECGNAATMCGIASSTVSENPDVHCGLWGATGTYGAFTPLFYIPLRIYSQQNQDSPFALGVVTVVAGHSGVETGADARSHFGIFAPQCWTLFPKNQIVNLYCWDYNDVCPAYFAAVQMALANKNTGIIAVHVARPDQAIADRSTFADTDVKASAKGAYIIRDYDPSKPKSGVVLAQGCSSTMNSILAMPDLEAAGVNVKLVAVISEELFSIQSADYRESVLSAGERFDCMAAITGTKRVMPLANLGPLTEEYSLSADADDRWRTGGSAEDVISEANLDQASIFEGIKKFANERDARLAKQKAAFGSL